MPSAFPGQIPPDRRYTDHDKSAQIPTAQASSSMWPSSSVSGSVIPQQNEDVQQRLRQSSSLAVRPLTDLTSNACRMVEAATSTWRYSPYEHRSIVHLAPGPSEKSFIKAERMSPKLRAASVSTYFYQKFFIFTFNILSYYILGFV